MFSPDTMIDAALMRRLFAAAPKSLPTIYAHPTAKWITQGGKPAPVRIDSNKNLHMSVADLLQFKQEVPVEFEERQDDVLIFKIALQPHHLAGGVNDRGMAAETNIARKAGLRDRLGFNPEDGSPKRADDGVPHVVLQPSKRVGKTAAAKRADLLAKLSASLGIKRSLLQ
jgi:hypothetical protein